jgi:hypothetical protein
MRNRAVSSPTFWRPSVDGRKRSIGSHLVREPQPLGIDLCSGRHPLLKRWEQGWRNATRIWQEISEQGYPSAYQSVVRIICYLKERERLGKPMPEWPTGISASHAVGILVKRSENRFEQELRTLQRLKVVHRVTERCCSLFEQFAGMLRDKEMSKEQPPRG